MISIKEASAEVIGERETHLVTAEIAVDGKEYTVSLCKQVGWVDVGGFVDQLYDVELLDVSPELMERADWEELEEELKERLSRIEARQQGRK